MAKPEAESEAEPEEPEEVPEVFVSGLVQGPLGM